MEMLVWFPGSRTVWHSSDEDVEDDLVWEVDCMVIECWVVGLE